MRALAVAAVLVATPVLAGPVFKPLIDARLRYEHVEQVPFARDADAVTARVRAGFEVGSGDFTLLAESEATLALSKRYNSGVNGRTGFPIVADPQNIELNRLQLQYRGVPKTLVTLGRQRINLDDQRFVGSVGFRDNEQTFDALRVEWSGVETLKADFSYARSVRTIWGIDGKGARPQAIDGDNLFATLAWKHKTGVLTGFAYLVDQDERAISGYRMSSQSYGARYTGAYPLTPGLKLAVAASYARQGDYHRNPNDYAADYWLGELGLEGKGWRLLGGYEVLGSSSGVALTSFQTPLATLHKFNGWADKFLVTPPNGLRDAYATAGYGWAKVGALRNVGVSATWHDYRSNRADLHYGREINLQLAARLKRFGFLVKYADYDARAFATDTKKFWASVEWTI